MNITSNLVRKRREVIWSSKTLNLVWKRGKASIHRESQTSYERGMKHYFESRTEEKRSYRVIKNSKPRAKEGQSINLSRILNLVRKRKGILSKPRAKEERNIKVLKLFRISGRREFELQSPSENSKLYTKQGQNIRYHCYGKFRMC